MKVWKIMLTTNWMSNIRVRPLAAKWPIGKLNRRRGREAFSLVDVCGLKTFDQGMSIPGVLSFRLLAEKAKYLPEERFLTRR